MKVFINDALSADGFIAKDAKDTVSWTSKADKKFFQDETKRAGVIVIGSKTFETIGRPLPGRRNIVLSRTMKQAPEGVEISVESPADIVSRLKKEGLRELAICGGSHVYTSFMKAGLVDEILLTVEPIIFGQGMTLFAEPINSRLELSQTKNLDGGAVVFRYSVIK